MKTYICDISLNSSQKDNFFFQTRFVEKIKIYTLCSITFFLRKSCRLSDNVGKCGRARQATDENTMRRRKAFSEEYEPQTEALFETA